MYAKGLVMTDCKCSKNQARSSFGGESYDWCLNEAVKNIILVSFGMSKKDYSGYFFEKRLD